MTFDSLNLPPKLRQEAEKCAASQGVSLNQFILWAVAEKVGILSQHFDDPAFPNIIYHRGASGLSVPILKGTGVRVQTLAIASQKWGLSPQQIAAEYDLSEEQVNTALAFYGKHRQEIDEAIASEVALKSTYNGFTINLYLDEQGDWLAHLQEMPNISAFGDTPQQALEELKEAWELVKEDYQEKGKAIPVAPACKKLYSV